MLRLKTSALVAFAVISLVTSVISMATSDTSTTEINTEATTPAPDPEVVFNFENNTCGWTLGRSNGAAWRRVSASNAAVAPTNNSRILFLFTNDVVSSTVMATSPRMLATTTGEVYIAINFFMKGSRDYPAFLKLRRATSYTTFDDEPALSLDGFGEQNNQKWINHGGVFRGIAPGDEFYIVLEGSVGMDNLVNQVAVSKIVITGAIPYPTPEQEFFDFSNGLPGWTVGNADGGKWVVENYLDIDGDYNMPPPSSGNNVLRVDRFDVHSGVVSIDSPMISLAPGTSKHLNIRFWMRGSQSYPSSLRVRRKTPDGVYDYLPFLDLSMFGDVNNQDWTELESDYRIPLDGIEEYFQLVIEADLGSGITNAVAIDFISIETRQVDG
ncbi:uncharacterized protein LOC108682930 [Hyalella azteca]|uniref:Uncharacterized protein LOC108682930 n=1 Tax=Hyalella azteca TaxID=294128 RepID=A0A8B7PNV2_HYAAZ|nr:uncharacterized protein LOC108682930 [Hyalella azteca]